MSKVLTWSPVPLLVLAEVFNWLGASKGFLIAVAVPALLLIVVNFVLVAKAQFS